MSEQASTQEQTTPSVEAQDVDFAKLEKKPIWIIRNGVKVAAVFNKLKADGSSFQAKIAGEGFNFFPLTQFGGLREAGEKAAPSAAESDVKSAGSTKGKNKAEAEGETSAKPGIDKEARKAEKAAKRAEEKAARDARKAEKAAEREKKKTDKTTLPKKSRGNGIRLSNDVLGYLKDETPAVSVTEGDQQMGIALLAESIGKRVEDVEKAVNVLVEKELATVVEVNVPAEEGVDAFSYKAVQLTDKGRTYVKSASRRGKSENSDKGEPMQKRIAELVRQFKNNDEIIAELSRPANEETGEPGYNLSRAFVSTVRSRMRDAELYDFKYSIAEDFERDYLGERRKMDKAAKKAAAAEAPADDEAPAIEGAVLVAEDTTLPETAASDPTEVTE